jgi:hypothetical protein
MMIKLVVVFAVIGSAMGFNMQMKIGEIMSYSPYNHITILHIPIASLLLTYF